jgi:hypothetical protein
MGLFNRRIHIPAEIKNLRSFTLILLFFCILTACTNNQLHGVAGLIITSWKLT